MLAEKSLLRVKWTGIKSALAVLCFFFSFGFSKNDETVYKVTLITIDDWKLYAEYYPPHGKNPVIIFLHSLESNLHDWKPILPDIQNMGYGYLFFDLRGHGGSIYKIDGSSRTYESFAREGTNNEYNRMVNDVFSAIRYLNNKGIETSRIILAGAGLGANVAIKACAIEKDVSMMALLTPTLNANRGVLTVKPLKEYGRRPLFIASSVKVARLFRETSILQAVAYLTSGPGLVTYVTQFSGDSADLIENRDVRAKFIQWLKTPYKPEEIIIEAEKEILPVKEETNYITETEGSDIDGDYAYPTENINGG